MRMSEIEGLRLLIGKRKAQNEFGVDVTAGDIFFFFSSRRRHTRLQGDWSSDVCSSDLGRSPVVEPGVEELIASGVKEGRLRATTEVVEAVMDSDISLVCVGTPGNANGSLDLTHVKHVCKQIGSALETKHRYHVVVIRSTMLPGTVHDVV